MHAMQEDQFNNMKSKDLTDKTEKPDRRGNGGSIAGRIDNLSLEEKHLNEKLDKFTKMRDDKQISQQ